MSRSPSRISTIPSERGDEVLSDGFEEVGSVGEDVPMEEARRVSEEVSGIVAVCGDLPESLPLDWRRAEFLERTKLLADFWDVYYMYRVFRPVKLREWRTLCLKYCGMVETWVNSLCEHHEPTPMSLVSSVAPCTPM